MVHRMQKGVMKGFELIGRCDGRIGDNGVLVRRQGRTPDRGDMVGFGESSILREGYARVRNTFPHVTKEGYIVVVFDRPVGQLVPAVDIEWDKMYLATAVGESAFK